MVTISTRTTASVLLVSACLTFAPAFAQVYPAKPIRILVGFSPGGGVDLIARIIGSKLTETMGKQVIVENRPGAAGNIAAEIAAKSPPDGYNLLLAAVAIAISQPLYSQPGYNLERDFSPVIELASVPDVVVVHPSLPVKSLRDLVALARSKPGQLSYSSGGIGSPEHMLGEMLNLTAKLNLVHVPYKGGALAVADLVAGHVAVSFNTLPAAMPHIKTGRLRILAVTDNRRSTALPDVPTSEEAGVPGLELTTWYGVVLQKGTPQDIVARLNSEINRILRMADVRERFAGLGAEIVGGTPEHFGALIATEVAKFEKVIKAGNIRAE